MAQVLAPMAARVHAPLRQIQKEILRTAIVCGCAFALIAAGLPLPF